MPSIYTLADLRTGIEFAPRSASDGNPALAGFTVGDHFVCSACCGRLSARGCGYMLQGAEPVWSGDQALSRGERTCALSDFHGGRW